MQLHQIPRAFRAARAIAGLMARRARPRAGHTSGTARIPGLHHPVEVRWDTWGVPHVYAQSVHDLFLAQGYLHAEDRLWQLELHRRVGAGRLSELFGARTLEADRFLRRVGLHRAAAAEIGTLTSDAGAMLHAYAAGVNGWLATHPRLPLEFALLDVRPEPWAPVDSLTWAKLMGWGLSVNWDVELFRVRLAQRLGPEQASALEWAYPTGHPLTAQPGSAEPEPGAPTSLTDAIAALIQGGGSNAWVLAGSRTTSGFPILANDPHLVPQLPSTWYEMHLECPDFRAAGASLPGAPGITIGHNESIAWGITASMVDTQDLYLEDTSGAPTVEEVIVVRGRSEPVTEQVFLTRHGPIITDPDEETGRAYALRSTLLEPGRVAASALALLHARDWPAFRAALALWDAPSLNFLYADNSGNIGYQLAGRTPRRAEGDGSVPVPGWEPRYDWDGYLEQDELPHAFNPPQGYLANANNKPGGGNAIAGEWIDGYRAQRIVQLIEQASKLSMPDMKRMHQDTLSLPARELQDLLRGLDPAPELREFIQWDARMTPDSTTASLYAALRVRLMRALLTARLGPGGEAFLGIPVHPLTSSSSYQFRGTSGLLRLLREALPEGGGDLVRTALREALGDLSTRLGPDRRRWRWGRLHRVSFQHPMGAVRPLGRLLNRGPFPLRGDGDTVHQSSYSMREPYEANRWLPSLRFIADTGNWDNCLAIHAPGQSGRPDSRHYDDLIPLWLRGDYHPMPFSRAAVMAATAAVQTLAPLPPPPSGP